METSTAIPARGDFYTMQICIEGSAGTRGLGRVLPLQLRIYLISESLGRHDWSCGSGDVGSIDRDDLEPWASSLREVKRRMRPLFMQGRVALSAENFLEGLLGEERRKPAGCWPSGGRSGALATAGHF
jgi:hypothetical protein